MTETPADERVADESVGQALAGMVRHPVRRLVRFWNWKAAVLSSCVRASIFFGVNISAGLGAAVAAMVTELSFRGVTAGFYGAFTQGLTTARPQWLATLTVMVFLPAIAHAIELAVHWLRGTARLEASILASVGFTVLSTLFNLFAMRRGVLIVGEGRSSLLRDLQRMPRLAVAFIVAIARGARNLRLKWLSRRCI